MRQFFISFFSFSFSFVDVCNFYYLPVMLGPNRHSSNFARTEPHRVQISYSLFTTPTAF